VTATERTLTLTPASSIAVQPAAVATNTASPILRAALRYAERGWHVFPLGPRKQPLGLCRTCRDDCPGRDDCTCPTTTCHGLYAATKDPNQITTWFTDNPSWQLAIRTGSVSGLVVLDVDGDTGTQTLGQLERQHGVLPGTVLQGSGSGRSFHMLYAHPGGIVRNSASRLGPGLDVRGDGGYIVAAPSIHPATGRAYFLFGDVLAPLAPWPKVLSDLLEPPVPVPAQFRQPQAGSGRGRLLGVLTKMIDAQPGERNAVLHWCSARVGEMHTAGELSDLAAVVSALRDAAHAAGLSATEIGDQTRGTISSGLRATRPAVVK